MSEVHQEGNQRLFTRGAFLAAGAAAATAATCAGGGVSETASSVQAQASDMCTTKTCPAATEEWAIPAGTLNILWNDVFPRIVAEYWCQGGWTGGSRLRGWTANEFAVATQDPVPNTGWPNFSAVPGAWQGSPRFMARLGVLNQYLSQPSKVIPIYVVDEGEFDFVLSDRGLELFIPPQPHNLRDLIRYFTYRGTGRRAIGIPCYLDLDIGGGETKPSAMSTDSPTGPSQMFMNSAELQAHLVPAGEECADQVLQCLAITHQASQLDQRLELARRLAGREPRGNVELNVGNIRLSFEEYMCVVSPLSCWQISGAVYRGIMTELPRVVAHLWMEELDGQSCTIEGGIPKPSIESYGTAFAGAGGGDPNDLLKPSIRKIFKERLETSLPKAAEMRFQTYSTPNDAEVPGSSGTNWIAGDVMITNRGLFFPEVPSLLMDAPALLPTVTPVPGELPTDTVLRQIYASIRYGQAGNPVFTDSVYCD